MTAESIVIPVLACIKCAATERDKNGNCRACSRVMAKAWYAANKDRALANMRAWQAANPAKFKEGQAAWIKANPDKVKAASARRRNKPGTKAARADYYTANKDKFKTSTGAWHTKNPLEGRIHQQNARAKSIGQPGQLSRGLVGKLMDLQQGTCPCCRQPLGDDFQIDHIVASHNGGPNVDSNAQLLRSSCNGEKRLQDPLLFMQSRGYLL